MKKFTKEELETLSYRDIAFYLIEDKPKTTKELFETICKLHGLSQQNYEEKIGDFYTSLTTDRRFIFLDNGKWDLRQNHTLNIVIDDEDDDIEEEVLEMAEEEAPIEETTEDEEEEDLDSTDNDDYDEDELKDLYVIDEEELEE